MKKIFLIPLMTLLCTVMAWSTTDVADKAALQAALNAGGDIRLTADIALGNAKVTMTSGTVVLDLNGHNLTGTLANYGTDKGVLNVSGGNLTINATNGGKIDNTGSKGCGIVTSGSAKVTINGDTIHGSYEGIYAAGGEVIVNNATFTKPGDNNIWLASETGAKVTVKGGTFAGGWMCFQVDKGTELIIEGGTFTKGDGIIYPGGTITLKGGTFSHDIANYVSDPYYVEIVDAKYHVAHIGSNVAVANYVAYPSLSAAVAGASDGAIIALYANDNNSVSVAKNAVIETNGYTASGVSAGAEYGKFVVDGNIVITNNPLITFLQGNESAMTLDENVSFAQKVVVNGTKELTIPAGITVSATFVKDGCIVVPNGAKLTIYGNGTIAGDRNLIRVEKGGELVIGKADQSESESLKMTTTVWDEVNYAINNYGKATINNAEIHAASAALNTFGVMDVNGGYYTGEAYFPNHRYCVTADDGSQLNIKNARVFGVHGALACQGSAGSNIGGSAHIENCELVATDTPYLTKKNTESIHYGLYSASGGIVSVYNTKIKSTQQKRAIHIGNNDAWNTFGLVHVYEGCMVAWKDNDPKGNRIYVQKRTATDKEVLFPISVDSSSDWYKAAKNGGEGPLPAGNNWVAINNDEEGYSDGYRWKVVGTATEKQEATGTTIPWQQNTTWTDTDLGDVVPAATTAVTIPEGKTVVVSKDEANKNAVAEQLHIGSGASLTVQEGTTLAIGEGGINIADGGQLIVEDKAIVTVGEAGIVTTNENAIIIKSDAAGTGAFLIHPDVKENTRPAATVEMYAKAHKVGENWFPQHCGIPTVGAPESITFPAGGATYMDKFVADGANPWEAVTSISNLEPFVGYRLNFSGANEAGVYTFKGNLQGNGDAPLQFVKPYYNLLANSYTSPMDIKALFEGLTSQYGDDVDLTLWVYNSSNNRHEEVSKMDIDEEVAAFTTIAPMQGYILYCGPTQATAGSIDYESTIWNCAQKIGVPIKTSARKVNDGRVRATIVVSSPTSSDKVVLREADNYSNAFENGADARKYMSENVFNIYSTNDGEAFSQIATDNLLGTAITVKTANETAYTLSFSNVQNFNYAIRDNLSGAIIPVEEGMTYEFTMNEGAIVEGRFEVVERYNTPTGVENIEAVRSAKGIYTVLGQYIGESSLLNTLPTGIYVVDGQRIVK